jgi:DNA topoisomerase-6 subunit B
LQKIAAKRTGGQKTDEALGRNGGPEGLPFSIIVTPEGTEGDAPVIAGDERSELAPPEEARADEPLAVAVELDASTESLAKVKKKTAQPKQQSASKNESGRKSKAASKKSWAGSKRSKK